MIDTHSHIYLPEFDDDRADVVARARKAGLRHLVMPNVDMATYDAMVATNAAYPAYTSMAMGLHPTSVEADWMQQLEATESHLDDHSFVAIGEVGIDLYWDDTYRRQQMTVLREQLLWAARRDLPVIIHCRNGLDEVCDVFDGFGRTLPECVFHSFGGTKDDLRRIRRYGDFYFGINGVVTFKNAHVDDLLEPIGLDRILLETDCPYLTPVPYRGKRNESAYVPLIAEKIADTLGVSVDEVSEATDSNASHFFKTLNA